MREITQVHKVHRVTLSLIVGLPTQMHSTWSIMDNVEGLHVLVFSSSDVLHERKIMITVCTTYR